MNNRQLIFSLGLLLICSNMAWSTARTVSNDPSFVAQFSDLQLAIDASNSGDTIYIYGSPTPYTRAAAPGFLLQDKRLVILGPGWAPDKIFAHTAKIGSTFNIRDSGLSGSPSGTQMQGLVFTGILNLTYLAGGDLSYNNVQFIRCRFDNTIQFTDLDLNNFLFEGCIFNAMTLGFSNARIYTDFVFRNSIFFVPISGPNAINSLVNAVRVFFDHNLWYSNNNGTSSAACRAFANNCRRLTFSNNIFNQVNVGDNLSESYFTNNITNNVGLGGNATSNATPWAINTNTEPTPGTNISNTNPNMANQSLIDSPNPPAVNPLLDFSISTGPANNAGTDGKDLGLLYEATGPLNWANSRNSRVPRVYNISVTTPVVPAGGNLSVTVDARKSN